VAGNRHALSAKLITELERQKNVTLVILLAKSLSMVRVSNLYQFESFNQGIINSNYL